MSDRESHDFMTVDSFSQLPFMRRDKPTNPPIRLFGFDFPPNPPTAAPDSNKRRSSSSNTADSAADPGESLRKFECNYCFRNFPTSQALGGHQNAHKRERQIAKRANLAASSAGGHLQSLLGYNSHGVPPPAYPSWSFSAGGGGSGVRFYGGLGSVAQPINGSPMPGIWGASAPAMHYQRGHFTEAELPPSLSLLRMGPERRTTSAAPLSREWHGHHEPKDGVSLDLHL